MKPENKRKKSEIDSTLRLIIIIILIEVIKIFKRIFQRF